MAKAVTKIQTRIKNPKTGKTRLVTTRREVQTNQVKGANLTPRQLKILSDKQVKLATIAQAANITQEVGRTVRSFAPNKTTTGLTSENQTLVEGGLVDTASSRDDETETSPIR